MISTGPSKQNVKMQVSLFPLSSVGAGADAGGERIGAVDGDIEGAADGVGVMLVTLSIKDS